MLFERSLRTACSSEQLVPPKAKCHVYLLVGTSQMRGFFRPRSNNDSTIEAYLKPKGQKWNIHEK